MIKCQFSLVQSLSRVQLFATPLPGAHQALLSVTNSQSPPKLMSIESVVPSNHLIFCHPLLLLPSIFPSIRVFSNESVLPIRWPKYWSFSFSISPSNEYSGLYISCINISAYISKYPLKMYNTIITPACTLSHFSRVRCFVAYGL